MAFAGNYSLTEVRSQIENPFQIDSECFDNYDIPLYVPAGTKGKYMATEGWKNFTNIVEMEGEVHYDVTNNGEVDNDDLNSLLDVVMNRAEAVENYTYDVNNDNKVDIADVTCVIDRILYLERLKTLSTGSEEEVRTLLEDLSGTSHLNASDAAAALTNNPNVEEAYTEDGNNVIVKMSGESGLTMYPCYELSPVFSDEMIPNSNSRISQQREMKRQTRASKGRIAIFSFFDYNQKYRQQSKIVDELYLLLDHYNGYDVEFYGVEFTSDKLKEVINSSSDYKAIIIMSYGGIGKDDKSYIATREKSTSLADVRMKNLDPDMKDYYKMIPTDELLKVSDNCILYLGASCSVPYQGLGGRSNIIGWRDKTSVIQTHAYLLFTAMTEHGLGLKDALESIPSNDPFNENASLYAPYADNTLKLPGATTNQEKEIVFTESISKSKYYKKIYKKNEDGTDICIFVDGRVLKPENGGLPSHAKITLKPLLWSANGDTRTVELYVNDDYSGLCDHFAGQFYGSELEEGVYEVQITALYGDYPYPLYPEYPLYYVVSSKFSDTYAPPVMPVAGMRVPVVRTKYNQMVDEVKLAPGGTKSYVIDGYEGHQFKVSGGDDDIATATISDNTLTIKGGTKLGPTAIYVDDVDNHHSAVVSIELFEFDELVLQSYETKSMKKGDVYLVMITSGSGKYIVTSSQPDKATADVMKSGTSYYVKVTALATGSSTITVNDNESGEVKEFDVKVEGVDLKLESNDVLSLKIGEQWVLKIISGNGEYTVESSQPDKVTATIFRSGTEYFVKVVGNEVGASSIVVTDKLGKQTGFQVSVVSAVDFTLGRYYFNNLEVGEKDRVEITSGNGDYTVESSDPLVATASIGNVISLDPSNPRDVDYVEVEGKKAGSACITVTDTKSGQKHQLEVFVGTVDLALAVNSVNLYETGEEKKVKITSGNGGYTAVSNRTSVATVSIEKEFKENAINTYVNIKAVDAGPATITVTDSKGKTATIQVQVTPDLVCLTCPDDHHPHMIDLGLPSGTLWACCNVGASKPEDYGGYYAWGETETKVSYNWNTYQYGRSEDDVDDIGSEIAGTQYDAATANWDAPWQMPMLIQFLELKNNTTSEWTTQNGVNGRKFTGANGGTIFLPAAGNRDSSGLVDQSSYGIYWSSSLLTADTEHARYMVFNSGNVWVMFGNRFCGRSVRPVLRKD